MKKKVEKHSRKLRVGDYTHNDVDTLEGIYGYTPATIDIKCKYIDQSYIAERCKYKDDCVFKRQIEESDAEEYPDLFIKDDE